MSSICGAVYINGKPILKEKIISTMKSMSIHPYDSSSVWHEGSIFMGCNLQHITPESRFEVLPRKDSISGLSITADAIIDNRKELFSLLGIPLEEQNIISDSELILKAYKKWKKECPKYLEGEYAFAIWDKYSQELFCARDHVGKRTFYFYYDKNSFIFSTLMKPIYVFNDERISLNERWIADYLGLHGVIHEIDCNDTIYEGIYQLPPATTLTFNHKGMRKEIYWNPLNLKTLKFKHDYEYDEAFIEVFSKAISSRLRTEGEVGIFLSGGLDSTAVGALAARELARQNKELKAYHAIPIKSFTNTRSKYWVADESEYIDELIKLYPNINVQYISSEDKNSYSEIDWFTNILEHPFKPVVNYYWVNDIYARASNDGCKVILSGQYGNFSISYGNYMTNIYEMLKRGKFYSIYKEINSYSKLRNINRNYMAKTTMESFIPARLSRRKGVSGDNFKLIHPDLDNKWDVSSRIDSVFKSRNIFGGVESIKDMREFFTKPSFFSHLGSIETKMGLANKAINRDPTRDKNVIEFCTRLPWHQFVQGGKERYFIRRSMAGIVPDKIRFNYNINGKQGADWIQRIVPMWSQIREELSSMLEDPIIQSYIDIDKSRQVLSEIKDINDLQVQKKYALKLKSLFICLVFHRYLREIVN